MSSDYNLGSGIVKEVLQLVSLGGGLGMSRSSCLVCVLCRAASSLGAGVLKVGAACLAHFAVMSGYYWSGAGSGNCGSAHRD